MVAPPQADLLAQGWEVPVFPQSPGLLPARPAPRGASLGVLCSGLGEPLWQMPRLPVGPGQPHLRTFWQCLEESAGTPSEAGWGGRLATRQPFRTQLEGALDVCLALCRVDLGKRICCTQ